MQDQTLSRVIQIISYCQKKINMAKSSLTTLPFFFSKTAFLNLDSDS